MKILTFIGYYLPGYKSGGPVRTISNLVNLLHTKHEFKIITKNRDLLENKPYQGIKTNEWNKYGKCEIFYTGGKIKIQEIINSTDFDIYYLNSFFDYKFSIKILLLSKLGRIPPKPVLLAPRGEFSTGALSLKKTKKKIFLILSSFFGLHKNITWHASSKYEAKDVKREIGETVNIKIAMDVPDFSIASKNWVESLEVTKKREKGKLKILFISRISPKKNLHYAIEVLNKVSGDFTFDIYGPISDKKFWEKCKRSIDHKISSKVTYSGLVPNDKLSEIYPNYDLLFFPTLGENFGHVIFESLSFGCPVLISDQTPWDRVNEYGAGRTINLKNIQEFVNFIEEMIQMDIEDYEKYPKGSLKYIRELQESQIHLKQNLELFKVI